MEAALGPPINPGPGLLFAVLGAEREASSSRAARARAAGQPVGTDAQRDAAGVGQGAKPTRSLQGSLLPLFSVLQWSGAQRGARGRKMESTAGRQERRGGVWRANGEVGFPRQRDIQGLRTRPTTWWPFSPSLGEARGNMGMQHRRTSVRSHPCMLAHETELYKLRMSVVFTWERRKVARRRRCRPTGGGRALASDASGQTSAR